MEAPAGTFVHKLGVWYHNFKSVIIAPSSSEQSETKRGPDSKSGVPPPQNGSLVMLLLLTHQTDAI